jgi:hypothetical protein
VVQTSDARRPSNKLLLPLSSHFGKFGRPRSRTRSSIDVNETYCSFEGIVHIMPIGNRCGCLNFGVI